MALFAPPFPDAARRASEYASIRTSSGNEPAEVQHIAATLADGKLAITQIVVRSPSSCFDPEAAANAGYSRVDGTGEWYREATDMVVEGELAKAGLGEIKRWRRIDQNDIPTDRSQRDLWEDTGKAIRVRQYP